MFFGPGTKLGPGDMTKNKAKRPQQANKETNEIITRTTARASPGLAQALNRCLKERGTGWLLREETLGSKRPRLETQLSLSPAEWPGVASSPLLRPSFSPAGLTTWSSCDYMSWE